MNFGSKKYDIVRTDKMSSIYDGALSEVHYIADEEGGLENGRIVTADRKTGLVTYAKDQDGDIYLHASVERNPYSSTLTDFIVEQGSKARLFRLQKGDIFSTSAFKEEELAKGDVLKLATKGGTFEKDATSTTASNKTQFEFIEFDTIGFVKVAKIRVIEA